MITKGIIEDIISQYEVVVRIPILDSISEYSEATHSHNLSTAFMCIPPRLRFVPQIGDVVIIGFEDNDRGKPIIIGCLFKESGNLSQSDLELRNLEVSSSAKLSKQTTIGDVNYEQIKYLQGLGENVQLALNDIYDRLKKLEENS